MFYASEDSHHSLARAAKAAGMGEAKVRAIEVDGRLEGKIYDKITNVYSELFLCQDEDEARRPKVKFALQITYFQFFLMRVQ